MSCVCVQHLCSNERREGEWLRSLDVVLRRHADATGDDDGLYLHVVDRYPAVRDCITNDENASAVPKTNVRKAPPNHECAAVRRSCLRIIEDHDIDLAEFAFAHQHSMNRSKVTNKLCYELNPGICSAGRKFPADLNFTGYLSKLSSDAGQDGGSSGDEEDMLDGSTDDENRLRLSPFVMLNKEAYDMEKMMMDMQVRFVILAGDALCADPNHEGRDGDVRVGRVSAECILMHTCSSIDYAFAHIWRQICDSPIHRTTKQSSMPDGQRMNFEMKSREDLLREMVRER